MSSETLLIERFQTFYDLYRAIGVTYTMKQFLFRNYFLGLDILIFIIIIFISRVATTEPIEELSGKLISLHQGEGGGSQVRQCKLEDCLYVQIPCDIPRLSKTGLEIHWFCVVLISVPFFAVFPFDVTTVRPSNLLRLATTVPTQNLIG